MRRRFYGPPRSRVRCDEARRDAWRTKSRLQALRCLTSLWNLVTTRPVLSPSRPLALYFDMLCCLFAGCSFKTTSAARLGEHKDRCEHSTSSITNFLTKRAAEQEEFQAFKRARIERQREHETLINPVRTVALACQDSGHS